MSEWVSDCCGAPHDDRFQFDDFMSNEPIGICEQCKEHVSFHRENEDGND